MLNYQNCKDVAEAEPGIKGDTATGATNLATGYTLNVPLFVREGDTLVINTSDGSYISRDKHY